MSKFWFRKNHQFDSPARLAEAQNLVARQEAYDRAKDATLHLLNALKQWPGFDSTGNVNGAVDHTLVNIDRLDDALDDLRDQVDKFRKEESPQQRAGEPVPEIRVPDSHEDMTAEDVLAISRAMHTAASVGIVKAPSVDALDALDEAQPVVNVRGVQRALTPKEFNMMRASVLARPGSIRFADGGSKSGASK